MLIRRQSVKSVAKNYAETAAANTTYQFEENEIVLNPSQIHLAQGSSAILSQDFYDINLSDHDEKTQMDKTRSSGGHTGRFNNSFKYDEDLVEHF